MLALIFDGIAAAIPWFLHREGGLATPTLGN
jgi:hypothetical protein